MNWIIATSGIGVILIFWGYVISMHLCTIINQLQDIYNEMGDDERK